MDEQKIDVQVQAPQLESNEQIINGKKVVTYAGYGGFLYRLGAYIVDSLVSIFIIPIFVNIYFYYANGDTIGYKALGLKIVSTRTGQKPKWTSLLLRFVYKLGIPLVMPIIGLAMIFADMDFGYIVYGISISLYNLIFFGYAIWIAVHPKKQAPYDQMAKTMVVQKDSKSSSGVVVVILIAVVAMIVVIGILSSVVLTSLNSSREKAMDTMSIADLKQIALALELDRDQETGAFATGTNFPVQEIGVYLAPFPQGDYVWIDNTADAGRFCAYVRMNSSMVGSGQKYFYVSETGSEYTLNEPDSLDSCGPNVFQQNNQQSGDAGNFEFQIDENIDLGSMTDAEFEAYLVEQFGEEN